MTAGIEAVLRQLHRGENDLEKELLVIGERHRSDHEVAHVTTALARWSHQNLEALSALAGKYGSFLGDPAGQREQGGPLAAMREKAASAIGHRPEPALLLLRDLRRLYLMASENSIDWTMAMSAAVRAMGPAVLTHEMPAGNGADGARGGAKPSSGTVPGVGRSPYTPQNAAGMPIDPTRSEP
jgi:hypothetical protein